MNDARKKRLLFLTALALIGVTAGALVWLRAHQRLGEPGLRAVAVPGSVVMKLALPAKVLDFTSTNVPTSQVVLDYLPKDTSFAQRYYSAPDGTWAVANVILMGADRTSIHRPEYCLPGQGWQIRDQREVKLQVAGENPYELPVQKWTIANTFTTPDGTKQPVSGLYVFWFVTKDQITADFATMLRAMLVSQIRHGTIQRWAYVSYFTACAPGQEENTFARIQQLITASAPEFQLPPAAAK
jgi:Protein of unknown function (DUF3485)